MQNSVDFLTLDRVMKKIALDLKLKILNMKSVFRYILIFVIASFISCSGGGDSDNNTLYQYHTYEEIGIFLDEISAAYPHITTLEHVGYSESGRDIMALIISGNPSQLTGKPAIRLTGGIHGNEVMGIELLIRFIEYLTSNYQSDTIVQNIVDNKYICIIPVLNPDGLVRKRRYNDNNIDLNRNFDAAGDDLQKETKSLQDYSLKKSFVLSITYHVGQVLVNMPFDYAREIDSAPVENELVKFYAKTYTKSGTFLLNPDLYKSIYMDEGIINGGDWYVINGSLQDWSYLQTGCLDFTIEVSNRNPNSEIGVEEVFLYNRDSLVAFIDKADQGIYGRVTNSSGKPISGVEIETSWNSISGGLAGDIIIRTDSNGYYNRILLPGRYTFTFTKSGYTTEIVDDVSVANRAEINIQLQKN